MEREHLNNTLRQDMSDDWYTTCVAARSQWFRGLDRLIALGASRVIDERRNGIVQWYDEIFSKLYYKTPAGKDAGIAAVTRAANTKAERKALIAATVDCDAPR